MGARGKCFRRGGTRSPSVVVYMATERFWSLYVPALLTKLTRRYSATCHRPQRRRNPRDSRLRVGRRYGRSSERSSRSQWRRQAEYNCPNMGPGESPSLLEYRSARRRCWYGLNPVQYILPLRPQTQRQPRLSRLFD